MAVASRKLAADSIDGQQSLHWLPKPLLTERETT